MYFLDILIYILTFLFPDFLLVVSTLCLTYSHFTWTFRVQGNRLLNCYDVIIWSTLCRPRTQPEICGDIWGLKLRKKCWFRPVDKFFLTVLTGVLPVIKFVEFLYRARYFSVEAVRVWNSSSGTHLEHFFPKIFNHIPYLSSESFHILQNSNPLCFTGNICQCWIFEYYMEHTYLSQSMRVVPKHSHFPSQVSGTNGSR